jgi:hypothetical protein
MLSTLLMYRLGKDARASGTSRFRVPCPCYNPKREEELTVKANEIGSACWARTSDPLINSLRRELD